MKCIICESSNIEEKGQYGQYLALLCKNCGLLFHSPMELPVDDWHVRSTMYRHRNTGNYYLRKDWVIDTFFNYVKLNTGDKLLDVGCGEGIFLYYLQNLKLKTYGIDIDPRAIAMAGKICKNTVLKCSPFKDSSINSEFSDFDIITSFNYLEHITDPVGELKHIYSLLKTNGICIIALPNYERVPKIFDPVTDRPPNHFTLWSKESLRNALENTGFKNIKIIIKQLTLEDIGQHYSWRIRRILGKINSKKMKNRNSDKDYPALPLFITKNVRIILSLISLNWIGRGHTLFAIGVKDK